MNTRSQTKKMVALNMTKNKVVITRLGVSSPIVSETLYGGKIKSLNPEGRSVTRRMVLCAKALHDLHVIMMPNNVPPTTNRLGRVATINDAYRFINTNIYIRECFENYRHIQSIHRLKTVINIAIDRLNEQIAEKIIECIPGDTLYTKLKELDAELKRTTKLMSSLKNK